MTIEKNIPIPRHVRQSRWRPLVKSLKVGDSFLMEKYLRPGEDEQKMFHNCQTAATRMGVRLIYRRTEDGFRVWRVSNREE